MPTSTFLVRSGWLAAVLWSSFGCGASSGEASGVHDCPQSSNTVAVLGTAGPTARAIPYDLPAASSMLPAPPIAPDRLPGSKTGESVASVMNVALALHEKIFVDGRQVAREEFLALARAAHAKDPDVRAVINADKDVPWGSVVLVIDQLKQASIAKIAFGVSTTAAP